MLKGNKKNTLFFTRLPKAPRAHNLHIILFTFCYGKLRSLLVNQREHLTEKHAGGFQRKMKYDCRAAQSVKKNLTAVVMAQNPKS